MRVLVACEVSGRVRDAFLTAGADAVSCDLLPSEQLGPHIIGDVLDQVGQGWDVMIAFPPCTHLSSSGARWWAEKRADGRQQAAIEFVMALATAPIPRIAIENPIGVLSTAWRKPDQVIQPWQFGHDASKATCLWLRGLPPLTPTRHVEPHYACSCGCRFEGALGKYGCPSCEGDGGAARRVWANQTPTGQNRLGPSPTRAADRARTYMGIAKAMAEQWSILQSKEGE